MSDTPRTDKLARRNHVVPTEWAEDLERECNRLRKDFKDSQTAVRLIAEALGNISIGTSCSECGGKDQARVAKAFLEAMR